MANALQTSPNLPRLSDAAMLLAFSGWMDGGEVSTGTVKHLQSTLSATKIASIDSDPFYILNFPGSMEVSALFRPHVTYTDGIIREFDYPENTFYCDPDKNIVLFLGKEPNLRWREFGDAIFTLARSVGVSRLYFVGSFGGTVPHTREPRLFASVSDPALKAELARYRVQFTDYEGPASFATYLLTAAPQHDLKMVSFAAEIPSYLQGPNPLSIEAVTRRLASILDLKIDLASMRLTSDEWTAHVTTLLDDDQQLAHHVQKLEAEYDKEFLEEE